MPVEENSHVSIHLTGLLVFLFAPDNSSCQIGVISNPEHKLRIGALKITSGLAEPLPIGDFSAGDIRISVVKPKTAGITFHTNPDFTGLEAGDKNDFRWTPDLEGALFHKGPLPIKTDNLSKIIHLDNGFFFTKTGRKVKTKPPDSPERIQFISEIVGINIDFGDPESELVFTYGPEGKDKLELKNLTDTKYKIVILNDRPVHPDTGHPGHPVELDFKFFYEVFDVPGNEQFKMFKLPVDLSGHPCGGGRGGKTAGFPTG